MGTKVLQEVKVLYIVFIFLPILSVTVRRSSKEYVIDQFSG
jgi:uncharacterized membrane protein YhaH (DUF805 family)